VCNGNGVWTFMGSKELSRFKFKPATRRRRTGWIRLREHKTTIAAVTIDERAQGLFGPSLVALAPFAALCFPSCSSLIPKHALNQAQYVPPSPLNDENAQRQQTNTGRAHS